MSNYEFYILRKGFGYLKSSQVAKNLLFKNLLWRFIALRRNRFESGQKRLKKAAHKKKWLIKK